MPRGVAKVQPVPITDTRIHSSFSQSRTVKAVPVNWPHRAALDEARFFLRFFFFFGFGGGSRLVSVKATSTVASVPSSEAVPIAPSGSGAGRFLPFLAGRLRR